jgi:hypothetical protein
LLGPPLTLIESSPSAVRFDYVYMLLRGGAAAVVVDSPPGASAVKIFFILCSEQSALVAPMPCW